jgi:hypothetical protein
MWQKDNYQEQMLGYLGAVQTEIEQLGRFRLRQHDLNELYTDLELTIEQLWRLIRASDREWEKFRFPLERSCDELLRVFDRVLHTGSTTVSVRTTLGKKRQRVIEVLQSAEMLG